MHKRKVQSKSVHIKSTGKMLILFVICTGYFGSFSSTSILDSQKELNTVKSVEIIYRWGDYFTLYYEYYEIKNEDGTYYTNTGKEIDSDLIFSLADSLTDLYEADEYEKTYEGLIIIDVEPHFEVRMRYDSGKEVVMKSDSDYHCFIPWNVMYDGKLYVQYNGKIPSALTGILVALDDGWSFFKESRWGCYSAVVPDRYQRKGISEDFPESKMLITPEEELGEKHSLWKVHLDSAIISSPVYANGRVFIISMDHVISFDAETGEKIWDLAFKEFDKDNPLWYYSAKEKIAVCEGVVYVCAPDSMVYALDCEAGDVLWKYRVNGRVRSLKVFETRVVVMCGPSVDGCMGMICFDREKGEKVWEICDIIDSEISYGDKVLFRRKTKESEYYALMEIDSGGLLWKYGTKIDYPRYHNGLLYFGIWKERIVVCTDVAMKEVWTYEYGKTLTSIDAFEDEVLLSVKNRILHHFEVFENGVLLLTRNKEADSGRFFLESVVLLDRSGSEIWKYYYPWKSVPLISPYTRNFEILEDRVFLSRERGFMDVFDVETGEKLWEIEVRGTRVLDFEVYDGSVYLYANDGRLYCLDLDTGRVIWFFKTEEDFAEFAEDFRPIYASGIGDGFIFVATKRGNLYAFSLTGLCISKGLWRI